MKQQLSKSPWITIAFVGILGLILLIGDPKALQAILAVPLVLFVPGFVLTAILFPWKSLGVPERLVLSIGLSIAFVALSGLILNLTPWGLQARTLWIALLLSLAVGLAVLFLTRRSWWSNVSESRPHINFNTRQWVLMSLAALMTIAAFSVARTPASKAGLEGYTLLSAQAGEKADTIRLGVRSEEFKKSEYQIKYQYNGKIHEGPKLVLNPGETWEKVVSIPVDQLAGKAFTVLLYRLDNPNEVYRHVSWWPETN